MDDDRNEAWVEERPRRRGLPRWLWLSCGCASFLALAGAVALYFGGKAMWEKGSDPEVQWPRLAEVLPFEERPDHLSLEFGSSMPIDQFILVDADTKVQGIVYASEQLEPIAQLFEAEPRSSFLFGLGTMVGPEAAEIEIQGRATRAMRFRSIKGAGELGPGVRVDLGQRDGRYVAVELRRTGTPPSDDDVRAFLAAFEVWGEE